MLKQLLFITVLLAFGLSRYSVFGQQTRDTAKTTESRAFVEPVEIVPEFPGGFDPLKKFLESNLKKIQGASGKRAIIFFVVETDGSLTDITVMRGINEEADKEAIRVMKLSPKWKPASQNGILRRAAYSIPIAFK